MNNFRELRLNGKFFAVRAGLTTADLNFADRPEYSRFHGAGTAPAARFEFLMSIFLHPHPFYLVDVFYRNESLRVDFFRQSFDFRNLEP